LVARLAKQYFNVDSQSQVADRLETSPSVRRSQLTDGSAVKPQTIKTLGFLILPLEERQR